MRRNFRVSTRRSRRTKVSNKGLLSYQKTRMGQSESEHIHVASRQCRSGECTDQQPDVPLAVVEEILLNLPEHQVVRVCRLVCREWKELVDSAAHWRERCRREGIQPCDASRPPEDWRMFYFITKKRRNLLKNPRADDEFQGWEIVQNGGDHWLAEENRKPFPDDKVTKCFITSYGFDILDPSRKFNQSRQSTHESLIIFFLRLCLKQQLIDLKKEGYSGAFMDQLQPPIKISDWYAPRFDCGCQYEVCVELLDQSKKPIKSFQPEKVFFQQWNDEPWCQMTHIFKEYGRGVRFIRFTHGGKDTQFWAGWYGIRVTNSSVEICPAAEK
ncbi:F-box only protein 44-like isoform X1 [Siphateles boraxobius]|uniref:F-box only protein 44-like isoform X1 n=1 Tax=Siphateles boraxobius TaxID=180520 RepID=UPI0040641D7A